MSVSPRPLPPEFAVPEVQQLLLQGKTAGSVSAAAVRDACEGRVEVSRMKAVLRALAEEGVVVALDAPAPQARRGTAFHAWLEERFGAARLVDLDELPGSGDELAAPDGALAELQAAFLASEWADRQPIEVEVPFETPLGPLTLRGRIDAVFADGEGYEVIDWKTGPPPSGAELTTAGVQLAAYRLGWSRLTGVPVERVSAGFHYVSAGTTVRPVDLLDEAGLLALVAGTER